MAELLGEGIFYLAVLLVLAIIAGLFAQLAYVLSLNSSVRWQVFGLINVFGLASFLAGGLFGFIFGVPRTAAAANLGYSILPNTNLEQISDWLTKVLVGATLTQIGKIPSAASALFTAMGDAMGTGASGRAFAGSFVIFAALLGFLSSWLATRTFVGGLLRAADIYAMEQKKGHARKSPS